MEEAHPTFNYGKGSVYSQDLYEFSEEEILAMCPSSVHKVTKMRNSNNMVLLTFFGSFLPDRVHVGPIHLRVRRFVARPLQCFSCYGYGHGRSSCRETSRCGTCSALGSHSEENCDADAYCFYCRDAHQLRSRQCPRYRLEQDILQLANTQFLSLGSARRELLYRQKDGTGSKSYASLAARSSAEPVALKTSAAGSRSVVAGGPAVLSANRFALLSEDSVESSPRYDEAPPALTMVTHAAYIHARPPSSKPLKGLTKRLRGSAESIDLAQKKQSKISPGDRDSESLTDDSAMADAPVPPGPAVTPTVSDPASGGDGIPDVESSDTVVMAAPRGPTIPKRTVRPDSRPPAPGKDGDSRHSPVGRKAAVPRPGTSLHPVTSRRLLIPSQVSNGQALQRARPSTGTK